MTGNPPDPLHDRAAAPDPPGLPGWVRWLGLAVVVVVVVLVVMMLAGGDHGPGMHGG